MASSRYVEHSRNEATSLQNEISNYLSASATFPLERLEQTLLKVLANVSYGKDMSELFPSIIMTTQSKSLLVKKMSYAFISTYARSQPSLSLLILNTLKKENADPDPTVRAVSLRAISSLPYEEFGPLIDSSIANGLRDKDPYVRKTAVLCAYFSSRFGMHLEIVDPLKLEGWRRWLNLKNINKCPDFEKKAEEKWSVEGEEEIKVQEEAKEESGEKEEEEKTPVEEGGDEKNEREGEPEEIEAGEVTEQTEQDSSLENLENLEIPRRLSWETLHLNSDQLAEYSSLESELSKIKEKMLKQVADGDIGVHINALKVLQSLGHFDNGITQAVAMHITNRTLGCDSISLAFLIKLMCLYEPEDEDEVVNLLDHYEAFFYVKNAAVNCMATKLFLRLYEITGDADILRRVSEALISLLGTGCNAINSHAILKMILLFLEHYLLQKDVPAKKKAETNQLELKEILKEYFVNNIFKFIILISDDLNIMKLKGKILLLLCNSEPMFENILSFVFRLIKSLPMKTKTNSENVLPKKKRTALLKLVSRLSIRFSPKPALLVLLGMLEMGGEETNEQIIRSLIFMVLKAKEKLEKQKEKQLLFYEILMPIIKPFILNFEGFKYKVSLLKLAGSFLTCANCPFLTTGSPATECKYCLSKNEDASFYIEEIVSSFIHGDSEKPEFSSFASKVLLMKELLRLAARDPLRFGRMLGAVLEKLSKDLDVLVRELAYFFYALLKESVLREVPGSAKEKDENGHFVLFYKDQPLYDHSCLFSSKAFGNEEQIKKLLESQGCPESLNSSDKKMEGKQIINSTNFIDLPAILGKKIPWKIVQQDFSISTHEKIFESLKMKNDVEKGCEDLQEDYGHNTDQNYRLEPITISEEAFQSHWDKLENKEVSALFSIKKFDETKILSILEEMGMNVLISGLVEEVFELYAVGRMCVAERDILVLLEICLGVEEKEGQVTIRASYQGGERSEEEKDKEDGGSLRKISEGICSIIKERIA